MIDMNALNHKSSSASSLIDSIQRVNKYISIKKIIRL